MTKIKGELGRVVKLTKDSVGTVTSLLIILKTLSSFNLAILLHVALKMFDFKIKIEV